MIQSKTDTQQPGNAVVPYTPASRITNAFRQYAIRPEIETADATGPMDAIEGQKALLLADVENLTYSARNLGFKVSYRLLADKLNRIAGSCKLHAFFSCREGDERWSSYFASRGWIPHPNHIEIVQTYNGVKRLANSDNLMLFSAGLLISRSIADVIIIASGDGSMVCDMTKALIKLPKRRKVITMSLAGSTSWRLDAAKNRYIAHNIEIGRDCLHRDIRWRR